MPTGTMSTNRRAKRTPGLLGPGVLAALQVLRRGPRRARPGGGRGRCRRSRGRRAASRSVTSAVGSASRSLSTATVRAKSVDSSHSRSAAAKAARSSSGARRPTSNSAWGIDRPSEPVCRRISSMMRGHASAAAARRRAPAAAVPRRPGSVAASTPPASAGQRRRRRARTRRPRRRTNSTAITATNSPGGTSLEPGLGQPLRERGAGGGRGVERRGPTPQAAPAHGAPCRGGGRRSAATQRERATAVTSPPPRPPRPARGVGAEQGPHVVARPSSQRPRRPRTGRLPVHASGAPGRVAAEQLGDGERRWRRARPAGPRRRRPR